MTNLWKTKGVPKKNWHPLSVHDRGPDNLTLCEMCGEQSIRYEHHMWHVNYKDLVVGCVCAENMAAGYNGKQAESLSAIQARYLNKSWETIGLEIVRTFKKKRIHIYKRNDRFAFLITLPDSGNYFTSRPLGDFETELSAKLAVWNMFVDEQWL